MKKVSLQQIMFDAGMKKAPSDEGAAERSEAGGENTTPQTKIKDFCQLP